MTATADAGDTRFHVVDVYAGALPFLALIVVLTMLRIVTAAYLPLSFDEAYFWLWSKHLAAGYFEHPPLIALAIRAGTAFFGDTGLGVRFLSLIASIAASWAVWRAALLLLNDHLRAWTACVYFNLTLMVASLGMGATPDIFVMAAAAFLLFSMAQLERGGNSRWWMMAAFALGVGLLAKYTAFFLVANLCLWLAVSPGGRRWLWSPWPYAAAVIVGMLLLPNLFWNETHDWLSFKFLFGKVAAGSPTLRHFPEFFAGQLALASPAILTLAIIALAKATLRGLKSPLVVALGLMWPAALYFSFHSLHDRVQGNWPSFIYPAVAILAASLAGEQERTSQMIAWLNRLAIPIAAILLAVCYLQTWTGLFPLGIADPIARMMAVGFEPVATDMSALAQTEHAAALVSTRYANTGWFAFYVHPRIPVLQADEEYRWTDSPAAGAGFLRRPLLYVTQHPDRELRYVRRYFSKLTFERCIPRMWSGVRVQAFCMYRLAGFHGQPGKIRIPIAFDPGPRVPEVHVLRPALP